MRVNVFILASVFLAAGASCVFAQSAPSVSPAQPLVVKLTTILDSSEAKPGKIFHAYAVQDWTDGQCTLRPGALLQGHVSKVDRRTKTEKSGDLHLVIDTAECEKHHNIPVHMSLIALIGPDDQAPGGESGVGKAPSLTDQPLPIGMRSAETAAHNNANSLAGRSLPTVWSAGMVVDLPGTTLQVGSGAEGGSIVAATNQDARLLPNTLLIVRVVP